MINTSLKFHSQFELAKYLNDEAASIRSRVSRASTSSQRIMSSEAAAYERAAKLVENLLLGVEVA